MTGGRWIAFAWWTFAFMITWGLLYGFANMGDCGMGPVGGMCEAWHQNSWKHFLVLGTLIYGSGTWLVVLRKRR